MDGSDETNEDIIVPTTPKPTVMPVPKMPEDVEDYEGGRRHKGSKKAHKTRKVNSALKSWVAFVKKVQHEEKISYPDAMKRASKRKSEWKRGGALSQTMAPASVYGGSLESTYGHHVVGASSGGSLAGTHVLTTGGTGSRTLSPSAYVAGHHVPLEGGRRRSKKRRGSKKRRTHRRR
jgi:hypothetical protein